MVKKNIEWDKPAPEHTKRKHAILAQYIYDYLLVRCQWPSRRFRLAVVDGFAGRGRYECGSPGSPLIFVEQVQRAIEAINRKRPDEKVAPIEIDCLLLLNDSDRDEVENLKKIVLPIIREAQETTPGLTFSVQFFNEKFEAVYPTLKKAIQQKRIKNALFNLDQCGNKQVEHATIRDILGSFESCEIFLTFLIGPLLNFLESGDPERFRRQLAALDLPENSLKSLETIMNKTQFLALAERHVFNHFTTTANFVSPFAIHNPAGWEYWLIHFTKLYRGRQVYNDVLHTHATFQAHSGRGGIFKLGYDEKSSDLFLHLFRDSDRERGVEHLRDEIARFVSAIGERVPMAVFLSKIYNQTAAHGDDIDKVLMECPDLSIITEQGGLRRKPNTIDLTDTLLVSPQRSLHLIQRNRFA